MDTVFGRIKFKRGLEADIPTLAAGEPYFADDTASLWVGSALGNVKVSGDDTVAAALTAHITDATAAHAASAISFAGNATFSATTVQTALLELDEEKASIAHARALSFLDL